MKKIFKEKRKRNHGSCFIAKYCFCFVWAVYVLTGPRLSVGVYSVSMGSPISIYGARWILDICMCERGPCIVYLGGSCCFDHLMLVVPW
jgi:hypothetical protein